ncbi:hypothetical protein Scani_27190 [Streptomyces caniferus]|uniref:Uncharacterized protein n=1 Tax=Streptomyces caniferus TaxID=285557 RepID=A0A640S7R1_9ACTN|nr:hypothetical protein Scani_27190 [Streptomyces caniferus]
MRTQRLADGVSKAEISQLGDQHYRAKIVARGSVLATLETNGHDDGLDANDMFVTLTMDGQVHSWMGGGHQGPGTFKLAGGWTAKVTKAGELRYRAQIIGHDGVAATLETKGHDVGLDANGMYIVLSAGGVLSAHASLSVRLRGGSTAQGGKRPSGPDALLGVVSQSHAPVSRAARGTGPPAAVVIELSPASAGVGQVQGEGGLDEGGDAVGGASQLAQSRHDLRVAMARSTSARSVGCERLTACRPAESVTQRPQYGRRMVPPAPR